MALIPTFYWNMCGEPNAMLWDKHMVDIADVAQKSRLSPTENNVAIFLEASARVDLGVAYT